LSVVVDANVVVKWYVEEDGSDHARALLASSELLIAPSHAFGEVGEVLVALCRKERFKREQLVQLSSALSATLVLVPMHTIFEEAVEIAITARQSFYDALYVSAAVMHDTRLVTADVRLVQGIRNSRWSSRVVSLPEWAGEQIGS
jgi:predicted nucleic acid-binding protein